MGKNYICQVCKIEFNQKSDYDKHINKKSPCHVDVKACKDAVIEDVVIEELSKMTNIILSDTEEEEEKDKKTVKKKIIKKTVKKKIIKKDVKKDIEKDVKKDIEKDVKKQLCFAHH